MRQLKLKREIRKGKIRPYKYIIYIYIYKYIYIYNYIYIYIYIYITPYFKSYVPPSNI